MDIREWHRRGVLKLDQEDLQDPGTMLAVNTLLDKQHDAWTGQIEEIHQSLGVSEAFAACIWYLRGRSRWTQELEDRLMQMDRNGEDVPNMCEWP